MIASLTIALLLAHWPQDRPRPTPEPQSTVVTIQDRAIMLPHLPASTYQARREYRAVRRLLTSNMRDIERVLASTYRRHTQEGFFSPFKLTEEKARTPEAMFFSAIINDGVVDGFLLGLIEHWNNWSATLKANEIFVPDVYRVALRELEYNMLRSAGPDAMNAVAQQVAIESPGFMGNVRSISAPGSPSMISPVSGLSGDYIPDPLKGDHIVTKGEPIALEESVKDRIASSRRFTDAQTLSMRKDIAIKMTALAQARAGGSFDNTSGSVALNTFYRGALLLPEDTKRTRAIGEERESRLIADKFAPTISKDWEIFREYIEARTQQFAEMEGRSATLNDPEINHLYSLATAVFFEQLKAALWLSHSIWAAMSPINSPGAMSRQMPRSWNVPEAVDDYGTATVQVTDVDMIADPNVTGSRLTLIRRATPIYRPRLGDPIEDATAVVRVKVAMDGSISEAQYVSGPAYLMEAAINAAKLCRFRPLKESGFDTEQQHTFRFNIRP